jgi:hypothetical protein
MLAWQLQKFLSKYALMGVDLDPSKLLRPRQAFLSTEFFSLIGKVTLVLLT